MISRAFLIGLIASVSMTSGCCCCNNPCWGWRLHPCSAPCSAPCGGGCGCPAYSSPVATTPVIAGPVAYRLPSGPDCPSCGGSQTPMNSAPGISYPPVIGNPMPIPGITPTDMIPSPMPMGKN